MSTNLIAVVGALPPPFGGVSVFVRRLLQRIRQSGLDYEFLDIRTGNGKSGLTRISIVGYLIKLWSLRAKVIHFHVNNFPVLLISAVFIRLFMRRRKIIVTLHNKKIIELPLLYQKVYSTGVLFLFDYIICVNGSVYSALKLRSRDRVVYEPAFIRPLEDETDISCLPENVRKFLAGDGLKIGSHGWFGNFINGNHVYGFEMLADVFSYLNKCNAEIRFYTMISGTYSESHRADIYRLRESYGLVENWMIIEGGVAGPALLRETDFFLRPSFTDGDSVVVRECILMGVPVLASDCVDRPDGCLLFKTGSYEDFRYSTERMIAGDNAPALNAAVIGGETTLSLYARSLSGS